MSARSVTSSPWRPTFLGVAAAYMVFLTVDQSHWWRLKEDYSFGWLVPLFVVYVLHDRWGRLRACAQAAEPSPLPAFGQHLLTAAAMAGLGLGLAVFAMGALYRAGSGATQPGSAAMAAGFAVLLPALTWLSMPAGGVVLPKTAGIRDARLHAVGLVLFPALVWLISAPLVSAVENAISLYLLRKVVAVVFFVFDSAGYSLMREGSVLLLPKGQVGVAEACSGIRSLTGCLFAGSFLAAMYLDRIWQKILLVGVAMGFAFLTNLARSLFLTGWAYAYGSEAIEGTLHDATGYAVLGLTSIGLFFILPLFRRANWARWLGMETPVASPLSS